LGNKGPGGSSLFHGLSDLFSKSLLSRVLAGFLILAGLNVATFLAGPGWILSVLDSHPWGSLMTSFVFDSWGTVAGLLGAVVLFVPVSLGTPARQRPFLSIFFFVASLIVGVASSLVWNVLFGAGGPPSYGSSAIDIAAQSIIFTAALFALIQSFVASEEKQQRDPYVRNSFRIIYATLVATTLWFILFLQPIFTPTVLFNWRVHEIAFLVGMVITGAFISIRIFQEVKVKPLPSQYNLTSQTAVGPPRISSKRAYASGYNVTR
jgi:hypothetical protein